MNNTQFEQIGEEGLGAQTINENVPKWNGDQRFASNPAVTDDSNKVLLRKRLKCRNYNFKSRWFGEVSFRKQYIFIVICSLILIILDP